MSEQWRALSPQEINTTLSARRSGPLAVVLWCTVAIALAPIITMFVMTTLAGPDYLLFAGAMMISGMFGPSSSAQIAAISLIPQLALFAWAAVTAVMGFSCNPATPRVSSILLVIWAGLAILSAIAVRVILVNRGAEIVSQFSLLPYIIFDVAVAAVYWGYMHDGRQPNLYFRRRVRV